MVDKQQLAAMGEHMREMVECKQKKHSAPQVVALASDYEKVGGHGLIVEMLKSYAELLAKSHCKPEFKVPDGWRLVPISASTPMMNAAYDLAANGCHGVYDDVVQGMYQAMLATAPEYKP